jgi:hypothetical protein
MCEADGTADPEDIHKFLLYSDDFPVVLSTRTSRSAIWSGAFMPFPVRFGNWGMCENEDLYKQKTKFYTSEECKQAYLAKFGKTGIYDLNASGVVIRDGLREKVYQRVLIKHKKK